MRRGFANLVGGLAIASVLAIGNPFVAYATGDVADSTSIDVVENEVSTQAEGDVAQIGDRTYATLDDAIAAAPDGATIELLDDAVVSKTLNKTMTIDGNGHKLTSKDVRYGFGVRGETIHLTLKNLLADFSYSIEVENPSYDSDLSLFYINADTDFTFENVTMKMDGSGASNRLHGFYYDGGSVGTFNLTDSILEIKNFPEDACEWSGNSSDVYITRSKFVAENDRSGFAGTFNAYISSSSVDVINNDGNGSNGSNFYISDESTINFSNNGSHGLSATDLSIDNSTVIANDNGGNGIHTSGTLEIKNGSEVTVKGNDCSISSTWTIPGAIHVGSGASIIKESTVTVQNNSGSGIYQKAASGTLSIEDSATVTITGNEAELLGYGGGLYTNGSVSLGTGVTLYNNHAGIAGDDVYNIDGASTTIHSVGNEWKLDGDPDCSDAIDGWYDDSANDRWEAHANTYDDIHADEFIVVDTVTINDLTALKAAHGLGTVAVTPADITIYMGGDEGYEGTATDDGTITGSNSLPEPGFYLTLSDDINAALQKAGHATDGEAADLSRFLKLYTVDYTVDGEATTLNWTLEKYGETHSGANNKFIYRIVPVPTEGQEAVPVRLQFTSPDGSQTFTNDTFDPSQTDTLYQQYTMQLYTNLVNANQVVFEVEVDGEHFYNTMKLEIGELTIRYVTGDQDSVVSDVVTSASELAAAKAENPDKAYALHSENAKFFINGSQVDVTDDAAPSLLFDDVVSDNNTDGAADYDQQLANRATDVIRSQGSTLVNPWFQAKYLDLVDANNGNTWLTSDEPTTVYWPYPAGTDENTEFHLVHFEGLNREISNGEITDQIAGANAEYVAVENTEHGIRFQTDGFSPFVLIWDAGEDAGEQPEPQPSVTKGESGGLPTTGDYTLTGAAVAAIAGVAALGYGVYASKRTH